MRCRGPRAGGGTSLFAHSPSPSLETRPQDVTDAVLFASFSQLPGCSDARVMWDHATGRSKGYGFVAMATREEAQGAIERMHGQVGGLEAVQKLGGRFVSWAGGGVWLFVRGNGVAPWHRGAREEAQDAIDRVHG